MIISPRRLLPAFAFLFLLGTAVALADPTSVQARNKAWEQHQTLREESLFKHLQWRSVGPRKQGGRIETIAVHPSNTSNAGSSWTQMGLEDTHHIGRVIIHPNNSDVVYVAAIGHLYSDNEQRGVFKTIDGGNTWTTVYVTLTAYREDDFTAHVYRSNDFGWSWQSIKANVPDEPVNVIREDPAAPGILYLGTDLGAYASIDDGKHWQAIGSGLPTIPVLDLFVHARDGELVAGTHGRSIYVLDIKPVRKQYNAAKPGQDEPK